MSLLIATSSSSINLPWKAQRIIASEDRGTATRGCDSGQESIFFPQWVRHFGKQLTVSEAGAVGAWELGEVEFTSNRKKLSDFREIAGWEVVLFVHAAEDLAHLGRVAELLLFLLLAHERGHLAAELVENVGVGPQQPHALHKFVHLAPRRGQSCRYAVLLVEIRLRGEGGTPSESRSAK